MTKKFSFAIPSQAYEHLSSHAKKANLPLSVYIKELAKNPTIKEIDWSTATEITKQITKSRNAIDRISFTIASTQNYSQQDIETVIYLLKSIFQGQEDFLKSIHDQIDL